MDPWTLAERGLPIRGGLPVAAAERLTGVRPCSHSGGWELTESWGKVRGAPGSPRHGLRWPVRQRGEAGGNETQCGASGGTKEWNQGQHKMR
jgi:hypothetical protein